MGLLSWLGRKHGKAASDALRMEQHFDPEIDRAIGSLAALSTDESAFRSQAKFVAERLGAETISMLRVRFHNPPEAPAGFGIEECGLGGWLACWQFAIFEVLYQFRDRALPTLRDVAFGVYDWTQANAIEVLCRLAAEGVDRERTLRDLKAKMPDMRDTALVYVARPLLQQAKSNPALAAIVDDLRTVPEFQAAIDELQ